MRRSAAPSVRKNPIISTSSQKQNITSSSDSSYSAVSNKRNTLDILQLISNKNTVQNNNESKENKPDKVIKETEKDIKVKENEEKIVENKNNNSASDRIYSVVWGKKTTKKHKTWEGDGFLQVKDNNVTFFDDQNKYMGKLSNFNRALLEEGYIFSIGGKEVQVIELVQNNSLKVSSNSAKREVTEANQNEPPKKLVKRIFRPKSKTIEDSTHKLVLPEPNLQHQWQYNVSKASIKEVIVAGCLSKVLRPHQRQGVVFLYECVMGMRTLNYHGAILADEMGLGKTLQAITLIWTLLKQGPYGGKPIIRRALIVAPSSLTGNWTRELARWLGSEKLRVYTVGSRHKITDYQPVLQPILIISYDMFIRCSSQIQEFGFDLLVCDEGHRLKNENIKLTTLLNQLECKRRVILTGTPIQNDLQELYSLANFVNPGILGNNIEYKRNFVDPIVTSREPNVNEDIKTLGNEKALELNRKIGNFILRRTQDILEKFLPTKTEMVIFCRSSLLQRELYAQVIDFWHGRERNSKEINPLGIIIALKKICNHPLLLKDNDSDNDDKLFEVVKDILSNVKSPLLQDSGKVQLLFTLLSNLPLNEKIVIVSSYTQTLDMLASICTHVNLDHCRLDGSTLTAHRTSLVEKFNNPNGKQRVILLSAKAGGVGLNLIGANRLVLFDSDWNPATDLQAMARVWRDGQKKNVYLYRLLTAGTIEEKIYQRQLSKLGLSGAVVDPEATNSIRLSDEELKRLFTIETDFYDSCLTHASLECNCLGDGSIPEPNTQTEQDIRDSRTSQLGRESPSCDGQLKSNQLMQWEHHGNPLDSHIVEESGLKNTEEIITFIFRNKLNQLIV